MLPPKENELITRVGAGTPMGEQPDLGDHETAFRTDQQRNGSEKQFAQRQVLAAQNLPDMKGRREEQFHRATGTRFGEGIAGLKCDPDREAKMQGDGAAKKENKTA